jgi:hypothetical protein
MKWSKNDPVSEKEINRNNAVYAIQNNRNPFIDYEGLEEYIWGVNKDVPFSYDNYEPITSISEVGFSAGVKSGCYTIDGRELPYVPMAPGLYILNGKKILVK